MSDKIIHFLEEQAIDPRLIEEVRYFRQFYSVATEVADRVPVIQTAYYGREEWEMALTALLSGENLLLNGLKATGKNILAENLAAVFGRPEWTVSFHANTDSTSLIGADTFEKGEVRFRRGSVYQAAVYGGFAILDEVNMAKNDAMAVLYSALDYRRMMDVPGYDKINLAEATRFIGTMNYGYVGTKELNEALVSRFMVLDLPMMTGERLIKIMTTEFPNLHLEAANQLSQLFLDLQAKVLQSEISSKALDIRGLLGALRTIQRGLSPYLAIRMGILGKVFDDFEKSLVSDVISLNMDKDSQAKDFFEG